MNPRLAGIALLALVLRVHGLGHESFWYDESVSVFNARLPLDELVGGVIARDVSPPLYFLVLALWSRIFGAGEVSVRALSALGSVAGLLLIFPVLRRLAGERVALMATFLGAISPMSIRYAQEARMYALLIPLASLAAWLTARELDRDRPRWAALMLANVALLYTHAFGALVILLELVAALVVRGRAVAFSLARAQIPVGLAFLPWARVMALQAKVRMAGFWIGPPDLSSVHYLFYSLSGGAPSAPEGGVAWIASKAVVRLSYALAGLALMNAAQRRATTAAAVALGVPIALVFLASRLITPIFVDRYFVWLAPAWWLWLAVAADFAPGRAALLPVVLIALCQAPVLVDQATRAHKEEWRTGVQIMRAGPPGELIVDTGGIMNLVAYLHDEPHPPMMQTLKGGIVQTQLPPDELLAGVSRVKSFWMFYSIYCRDRDGYRKALSTRYAEVTYRELTGLAVAYYRRR